MSLLVVVDEEAERELRQRTTGTSLKDPGSVATSFWLSMMR